MDTSHKDILLRLRTNIVADLDVNNDIIRPLMSEYILKDHDVKYIRVGVTTEERAERLLDLLPEYVYFIFVHCAFLDIFVYHPPLL